MRDCDIKFVNKEITPFDGLCCFSRCSKNVVSMSIWSRAVSRFKVLTGAINHSSLYWVYLQACGAVPVVLDILMWYVMTRHSVNCSAGNAERTTGLTSGISTNSPKLSTSMCSTGGSAASGGKNPDPERQRPSGDCDAGRSSAAARGTAPPGPCDQRQQVV